MWDPIHVVHVVQDSVVRAPQKYHAPKTIRVNHGSLRSIENPIRPASICKAAGRGVGPVLFAKVRVAVRIRRPLHEMSRARRYLWIKHGRGRVPRTTSAPHLF